jgi:hypothetical protein
VILVVVGTPVCSLLNSDQLISSRGSGLERLKKVWEPKVMFSSAPDSVVVADNGPRVLLPLALLAVAGDVLGILLPIVFVIVAGNGIGPVPELEFCE